MRRRTAGIGVVLTLVLLAFASLSWSPAVTLQIMGADGEPGAGAYVRYHYFGSRANFVDSLTYTARGSAIARGDASGGVTIPRRLHLRSPLPITTAPEVFVDELYVPRLHNATGPIPPFALERPGVLKVEEGYRVTLFDVSGNPMLWESSLTQLYESIREAVEGSTRLADPQDGSSDLVREMIGHLRNEYAALLARYRDTPRVRPPEPQGMTPEQRASWIEAVEGSLSKEPRWGPLIERVWGRRLEHVAQME